MQQGIKKIITGYHQFREKYAGGDASVMHGLSVHGQKPEIMIVACCDSRVDPALILQCDPGDLFVVRNVANIVPPYEKDEMHHGTSAALEFGIRFLQVKNLIIFGHSQCGGIETLFNGANAGATDFIRNWVSIVQTTASVTHPDEYAKLALTTSYHNCLTFPWIRERIDINQLAVHRWFFDIKEGQIYRYVHERQTYEPL